MKQLYLLLPICAAHLLAADVSLGVKAGFNSGIAETNIDVVESTKEHRSSYHVGGLVDVAFGQHWSLQPQVLYSGKGVKFRAPDHGHIVSLYSLDIPVNLVYKTKPGLFLGLGPNFGFNLRGTNEVTGDHPAKVTYKFGADPFDFKRFDFGINALAGYQHPKGPFASISYLKGLRKGLINGPGAEWSHNLLSVSFGYTFRLRR
jgi:hypothetical protein